MSVKVQRARRLHAARVAIVATLIVMGCYVTGAVAFNLSVAHRLTGEVDARLANRADDIARSAGRSTAAQPSSDDDHDLDDAPVFLWHVDRHGTSTALTVDGPKLGRHPWTTGVTAGAAGGYAFRFYAVRSGNGWYVAGESVTQIERTHGALIGTEVLFGIVLAAVAFVGSLVIGLRASAPLELVHRRQVEFTADASHEARTPLSVMQAEIDVALSRPRSIEEYRAVLRRLDDEGQRLRGIVGDLLWLARTDDRQHIDHHQEDADVVFLAKVTAERFQPVAEARHVTLRIDTVGSEPARHPCRPDLGGPVDRCPGRQRMQIRRQDRRGRGPGPHRRWPSGTPG